MFAWSTKRTAPHMSRDGNLSNRSIHRLGSWHCVHGFGQVFDALFGTMKDMLVALEHPTRASKLKPTQRARPRAGERLVRPTLVLVRKSMNKEVGAHRYQLRPARNCAKHQSRNLLPVALVASQGLLFVKD